MAKFGENQPLRSCRKVVSYCWQKTGVGDSFEPQFRLHLADRAQNFVNVVGPWPVYVYRLWSGSAAVCRTYSGKSPKSENNIGYAYNKKYYVDRWITPQRYYVHFLTKFRFFGFWYRMTRDKNDVATRWWKKYDNAFSHFGTLPACDRQTSCDSIVCAMRGSVR